MPASASWSTRRSSALGAPSSPGEVSPRYSGGGGIAPPPSTVGYNSYARSYLFWVDATGKISRTQIHNP